MNIPMVQCNTFPSVPITGKKEQGSLIKKQAGQSLHCEQQSKARGQAARKGWRVAVAVDKAGALAGAEREATQENWLGGSMGKTEKPDMP